MTRSTGVGGCGVDRQEESMSKERDGHIKPAVGTHIPSLPRLISIISSFNISTNSNQAIKSSKYQHPKTAIMPSQMDKSHASHIQSYTAVRSLPWKHFVDLCFCDLQVCARKTRSLRLQARALRCALRVRLTGMHIRRVVLRAVVARGRVRREAADGVEVGRVEVEARSRGQVGRKAGPRM